jgi:hypothetical protein
MNVNTDQDQSLDDMNVNTDQDQSLDDMNVNTDQDQSTNMENTHQKAIHFRASIVQGAVQQSSGNHIVYSIISSGATISQSAHYHVRSIINP